MADNKASTWMGITEVLDELDITRSTFDKWRARAVGPPAKRLPNGQLRIKRCDLAEWMDQLGDAA